ncbi:hypothetical protein B0I31_102728 [Saccharothrix carnea]|uniref:Uncharacterized protein n=1 Tax=Saccharothrix carnea TaxID=1280637 RepID=A0A2P8IH09_SACCR|nr:hypothetical protein B0I31_102728 [Saccharothrix carnea]
MPARSAASRQSRSTTPQPQHAPVALGLVPSACGSLCRSAPITVVLPAYRWASIFQSLIQVDSGTAAVYQRADWPAPVGRCRSRMMRIPFWPAYSMTLSRICNGDSPTRSGLVKSLTPDAVAPGLSASFENGTRRSTDSVVSARRAGGTGR